VRCGADSDGGADTGGEGGGNSGWGVFEDGASLRRFPQTLGTQPVGVWGGLSGADIFGRDEELGGG
jgi:hypothetical protein